MSAGGAPAVVCDGLGRVYRSGILGRGAATVALEDLSIEVPVGVVFGLLGPNGAGKTTTVRILSTLLTPTSGRAEVMGFDVETEAQRVRRQIGLVLGGERGLYGRLTGLENLRYFASLGHMGRGEGIREAGPVLERVGLADAADTRVERYSRGMKQRLHVARGLLTRPRVLLLDEPTIGIDPIGAQEIRRVVPELAGEGVTVLLTTHYMFEADSLCDRIALIDRGRLVALGTPGEIRREFSNVRVLEVTLREARAGLAERVGDIEGVERVEVSMDGLRQRLTVTVVAGAEVRTGAAVGELVGERALETSTVREPTLEEAYLSILS